MPSRRSRRRVLSFRIRLGFKTSNWSWIQDPGKKIEDLQASWDCKFTTSDSKWAMREPNPLRIGWDISRSNLKPQKNVIQLKKWNVCKYPLYIFILGQICYALIRYIWVLVYSWGTEKMWGIYWEKSTFSPHICNILAIKSPPQHFINKVPINSP